MTENEIATILSMQETPSIRTWGPGLLESVSEATLAYELNRRGMYVARQQAFPLTYGDVRMNVGFRADLVIEEKVIVEVKSLEVLAPVHKKQV